MRVFIGEYICGGGMRRRPSDEIDACLRAEGGAMLSALASDVARFAEVSIAVDTRLTPPLPAGTYHEMDVTLPLWGQWVRAAQGCDAAIIIAPETNGVLAKAVSMLRAANLNVVASTAEFLRAASDKQHTARVFAEASVPHPITAIAGDARSRARLASLGEYIVKPRDGCGTQDVRRYHHFDSACAATTSNDILQAYVPGKPVSVAVVANGTEVVTLPAVSQNISFDTCAYHGGSGPLPADEQRRAASLAQCALASLPPSARGFIGFDLVLADEPAHDVVIEVNARLTTSYVGLRHMVVGNIAARLLGLECGPVHCRVATDAVSWSSSGEVWVDGELVEDE